MTISVAKLRCFGRGKLTLVQNPIAHRSPASYLRCLRNPTIAFAASAVSNANNHSSLQCVTALLLNPTRSFWVWAASWSGLVVRCTLGLSNMSNKPTCYPWRHQASRGVHTGTQRYVPCNYTVLDALIPISLSNHAANERSHSRHAFAKRDRVICGVAHETAFNTTRDQGRIFLAGQECSSHAWCAHLLQLTAMSQR
jgi:hypothetical protein